MVKRRPGFLVLVLAGLASGLFAAPADGQAGGDPDVTAVDGVFEAFDNTRSPGCAVAVSRAGVPVLARAYGMADLEHDVPNTPQTIFEPGSVAKQFTAAATILLSLDGKLSLDDDVRTFIPELPDYGTPVTIRHLLNHTSGLRDWGSVAGIEGWPRTRRAHTHAHVLDILSRQESLNYPPGEYYSYTNSGYNLQAILVERVSGRSFADFTRERIFGPLGMTHTQWRDDFTRIVKHRAIAYRPTEEGGWSQLMPFEDVYGNGGLLTTVEDLLRFTWNLETGALGGPRFLEEMHHQGVLNSGQVIAYASGLRIETYKGVPQVDHSGSTAGYRGHLVRFPEQGVAVAVMCNAASGDATGFAYRVADLYLGPAVEEDVPTPPPGAVELAPERLRGFAGAYRDTRTGAVERLVLEEGGRLRIGRTTLVPVSETRFIAPGGRVTLQFEGAAFADGRPAAVLDRPDHPDVRIEPVTHFEPTPGELRAYEGTYRSPEAEAIYRIEATEGRLRIVDRWGQGVTLEPLYRDVFGRGGRTLLFGRDGAGPVSTMTWSESRVWGLRFERVEG